MAQSEIEYHVACNAVRSGSVTARLTEREGEIFEALARRAPRVVSREWLIDAMRMKALHAKNVDLVVHRLRRKLIPLGIRIETVQLRGYYMDILVTIVSDTADVRIDGRTADRLRELLSRCAGRPEDAPLAEQIRQAIFGAAPVDVSSRPDT